MAEVLSQSQIDALLNAARSGEMDLDAPALEPEKKYKKYIFLLDKSYYECYPISCRGAFFISIPVDMSGIEETGRKEKTPKMERTMMRFFWVQVQYICNCHRKMESYLEF